MPWVERLRRHWEARPLVVRMVGIIVILLAAVMTMVGAAMIGLLQRHLIAQIDEQLIVSAQTVTAQVTLGTRQTNALPTPYYIRISTLSADDRVFYDSATVDHAGVPQIPVLLDVGAVATTTSSGWTRPVTVASSKEGATWRALAIPSADPTAPGVPVGVVTIALPLTDVQHTLRTITAYFVTGGLLVVALGAYLGRYLVNRSLVPLRAIESIAGKIAAGDLTQRIPPEPPSTEVGSLALSLNTMLSQVEQSFQARKRSEAKIHRFVSDASHELRTPLAAIRGYCELYQMGGVPAERTDEVMGRIHAESTRMGSLVEDLLTLARLDEGRPLDLSDVDLVKVIDNVAFDLQALDPTRAVQILPLHGRRLPLTLVAHVDRERIQQVFTNLIGNIVRYTPDGSPVEFVLGESDGQAHIEIRDHGPGIDTADRERVFERFYRAENSRARSLGGSGLGLAIVADIVRAHSGSISLQRTEGGGLTARISLPLRQQAGGDAPGDEAGATVADGE